MDDIRRRDLIVLVKEFASLRNFFWMFVGLFAIWQMIRFQISSPIPYNIALSVVILSGHAAYRRSIEKRFFHPRLRELWRACDDRHRRLGAALKKLKKSQIADLTELPGTIDRLCPEVYRSLRKSDAVLKEIGDSERHIFPISGNQALSRISDAQAQELYRVADRNVAEYSRHMKHALSGVERAEAQAAVFTTTLDTLRIRTLNYRLNSSSPGAETLEFLNAVAEAKMQFEAIDKALEEIELMPFPQTIAVMPRQSPPAGQDDTANEENQGL